MGHHGNNKEALEKYGYKDIDWIQVYNDNDPHLHPIEVDTYEVIKQNFEQLYPSSRWEEHEHDIIPDYTTVTNYGLPAPDQYFVREEYPTELKKLEQSYDTFEDIWVALDADKYKSERDWIASQWHYRLHGKFYFINGKLTYLDGWAWFYNNYWPLDDGLPQYRDRDRRFFLFQRFCQTNTKAFFKYKVYNKQTGKTALLNDDKQYTKFLSKTEIYECEKGKNYIDLKRRVCYGSIYPKHRREGATYKAECINAEIGTRIIKGHTGIQSMSDDNTRSVFTEKLVFPMKSMPFFFTPMTKSSNDPAKQIQFSNPNSHGKARNSIQKKPGLMTIMSRATTANRNFYDGKKLRFLHEDELGKTIEEDVYMRHQVTKQCLSQGNGRIINGLTVKTSTVGEMTRSGGYNFHRICQESHYDKVADPKVGQTVSGLYILFIPAYDGLDGFIDDYGQSVIETPEKPIRLKNGQIIDIGAKEYLKSKLDAKMADGDQDGYNEEMRLHPTQFSHCFISSSKDVGFNVRILTDRLNHLTFNPEDGAKQGSLEWVEKFRTVQFIESEKGKFWVSKIPDNPNKMINNNGTWYPDWDKITISSADAFRFQTAKATGNKLSKGGGATFWGRDKELDPDEKDVAKWQSNRFICSYYYREHDNEKFAEDMLKMCIFFNSKMYPEYNVPIVAEKFDEWGFGGYLYYDIDPNTGKQKITPGFNTNGPSIKPNLFGGMKQYIELHGQREQHADILNECLTIEGLEDMTNHDLFTAASGCLYASEKKAFKMNRDYDGDDAIDITDGLFFFNN